MPSQRVFPGATLAVVSGGFGTTPVGLNPVTSWGAQAAQVAQTPNATTIAFSIPAPLLGGGILYYSQPTPTTNVPILAGSIAVPAGDIQAVVFAGCFGDDYQVAVTLSWFSDWTPTAQDTNEFTVDFAVAAPPGGGTLYWYVIPPPIAQESGQTSTLQDYLDELRRLLHDPLDQYWTVQDKVNDINRAMQRRDVDTGANRRLIPFGLTIGRDTYSFRDLDAFGPCPFAPILTTRGVSVPWFTTLAVPTERSNAFTVTYAVPAPPGGGLLQWTVPLVAATGATATGTATIAVPEGDVQTVVTTTPPRIFDVVGINLVYIAQRVVLMNMSFTKLNVFKRPWVPYQGIVEAWARYGTSQVIFGPQPSLNYLTEWDVSIYSDPLVNLTDVDPVPFPYTLRLVPMYAAYLAKINERQNDEAQQFLADYQREADVARNARVGLLPSAYGMTRV